MQLDATSAHKRRTCIHVFRGLLDPSLRSCYSGRETHCADAIFAKRKPKTYFNLFTAVCIRVAHSVQSKNKNRKSEAGTRSIYANYRNKFWAKIFRIRYHLVMALEP